MPKISAQERREALRKRTKRGVDERGRKGLGRKSVLDFSKTGNKKIVKYKVKSGKKKNYIDILPFEITQDWYKNLRSVSGTSIGLEPGFTDYKLEVPVHKWVGEDNDIFLCPRLAFGKKCPLCEELFEEWNKDEDKQSAKKIQSLKSSWRCFYNIFDYDEPDIPVQLWEDVSYKLFEEILQEEMETEDAGIVTFSDLKEGSSIEFKGREKTIGNSKHPFIEAHSISFHPRDEYGEDILKQTFPLDAMLIIPTYEEIAKTHLEMNNDNDNDNDNNSEQIKEESPQRTRTRQRFSEGKEGKEDNKSGKEESPPLTQNECPAGKKFGVDCNPNNEDCENCPEDIFQACAAKQDELKKEDVKEGEKDVKEETQERSRHRRKEREKDVKEETQERSRHRRKEREKDVKEETQERSQRRRKERR